MEAHEAMERVERMHGGGHGHGDHGDRSLAAPAAVTVAILAVFLAVATFLGNEQVKDVITGQTKASETGGQLEANDVKTTIADANAVLLRVVGKGKDTPQEKAAIAKAEALDRRVDTEFRPRDAALQAKIAADFNEGNRSDQKHTLYEIAEVGLQVGIVLAGISILARRRWLLGFGGAFGAAGIGVMFAGIAY